MTQTPTRTRVHPTPAVLTAATGIAFGPLDEAFAVIHDLIGGTVIPTEVAQVQARLRTELIRQVPWIAELRIPEFHHQPSPRFAKQCWLTDITSTYGGIVAIEIGTLADIPVIEDLPAYSRSAQ
jgi:hypothetical protein